MITLDDIGLILARIETTDLTECVVEHGAQTLRVRFDRTTDVASASDRDGRAEESAAVAAPVDTNTIVVRTPAMGIFHEAHPLVAIEQPAASPVRRGHHLGYLEIGSVFHAIEAPADGTPQTMLLQDGERVGYGEAVVELCIAGAAPLPDRSA